LGRRLAQELARRGWTIAGIDVQPTGLEELAREMLTGQHTFAWGTADVRDPVVMNEVVKRLEGQLGPIELLIACAGIAPDTPAVGMDVGAIARVIGVNLIGVSNTVGAVLPGMLARRRGHIVAISSLASIWGLPAQMGYCASKAGLNALMEGLRLDVMGYGLHVTTVCPGHTATPQSVGMYHAAEMMTVEVAAAQVLKAIDGKFRFHAFPRFVALQLRLLRWLPARLRERLLTWRMGKARTPAYALAPIPSNSALPSLTSVAPSSTATSKSPLIPMDSSGMPNEGPRAA